MLKRIMFNSSRIAVKQVDSSKVLTSGFKSFTSDKIYFVKLNLTGLDSSSIVNRATLKILNSGTVKDKEIEIIEWNNVKFENISVVNSYYSLLSSASQNTMLKIDVEPEKTKNIDLTNLIKNRLNSSSYDNSVVFAVRTNNNSDFQLDFCNELEVIYTNASERNEFAQYKSFDLGFAGTLNVDLLDGKLIHNLPMMSTNLSRTKMSYPISIIQDNTLSQTELGNGINSLFTKILINDDEEKIIFIDYTDKSKEYVQITSKLSSQLNEEEKKKFDELGIRKDNNVTGIWYCYNDLTYLTMYEGVDTNSNNVKYVEVFDTQNNKWVYWHYDNTKQSYLYKYISFKGDTIDFTYDPSLLLSKMKNSFNEELEFEYNTVNNKKMLTKIINNSSKDTLGITYDTSDRIKSMTYLIKGVESNSYYHTKKVELTYDTSGKLTQIKDNLSRNKVIITYTNSKVTCVEVQNFDKNKLIDEINFTYFDRKYTKVKDFRDNELTYMFNSYGQCFNIYDNHKRYLSNKYETSENGLISYISEKSKPQFVDRNLIFNSSFEDDNIFSSFGWRLLSGDISSFIKENDGVSGNNCLKIVKNNETQLKMAQIASIPPEIESKTITLSNDDLLLSGYVKCNFDTDTITNNDLVIKMVVSCIDRSDQTFSWHATNNIEEWTRFTIKGDIQGGSTVSKIELFVELNGQNGEVYLDDFNLTSSKTQTRYNVVRNGYFDKAGTTNTPECWTCTNLQSTDKTEYTLLNDSHPSFLGRYIMKFSKINLLTSSLDSKKKSISQEIDMKGLKNDHLVFSGIAKGLFSNDSTISVKLHFNYLNESHEDLEFTFLDNIEEWQFLTKEVVASDDYDKVILTITSTSVNDCYIDAIQLYKDSLGTHYSYDKLYNIESITSSDGTSMIMRYNDDRQVEEIITNNGEWFKFTYGVTNKEVSKIEDNKGNAITYTYDNKRNCTGNALITNEGKNITKTYEYDNDGMMCIKEIDELGNVKEYQYDNNSTTYKHGLLTSSSMNGTHLMFYGYNEVLLPTSIQKLGESVYHTNNFTYTSKMENSSVYNSRSNYKYTYDDFGKLHTIKVNDVLYCTNEYANNSNDINHNVLTKQTFEDGTVKEYIYDNEDNIICTKQNNEQINEFKYNERNLVSEVNDHLENQKYSFDYTSDGKMKKMIKSGKGSVIYGYDNLGNLQKSSLNIEGINKSYDFVHKNESSNKNLSYYYVKLAEKFNDDIIMPNNAGKSLFGATPKVNTTTYKNDLEFNGKVYAFNESSDYLWYDLTSFNSTKIKFVGGKEFDKTKWQEKQDSFKTFYMWVKPIGTFKETRLFTFQKITDDENEMLGSVVITSQGKLAFKNLSSNTIAVTTTNSLTLNDWNFVGVQMGLIDERDDGRESNCVKLSLNGVMSSTGYMIDEISDINNLLVGLQDSSTWNEYSSSSSELTLITTFTFDIAMVGFGAHEYNDDLIDIYKRGIEIIKKEVKNENDGITYYNTNGLSSFENVSLNGSFESNKGLQPYIIEKSYNMFGEVENFVYDNELNRQVFKCFEHKGKKSHIGFKPGLEESGTISLRFKYESNTKVKPLISISNDANENILVFVNASNELKVKVNGYEYSQYIPVNQNTWYEVILSMNTSSGLVFVEGNSTLSFTNNVNNIKDSIIRLGSNKDNTLSLNGYIEKLGVSREYFTSSQIQTIINDNLDVVLRHEYDGIGRITSKHLFVNDMEFNKSYAYKSIDGLLKTSTLIEKETLIDGRSQEYEYDDYGNVIKKTLKSNEGVIEEEYIYTYDDLFRLEREEILTYDEDEVLLERLVKDYTYDVNGNRLTLLETKNGVVINDYSYTYDTTHKDRLIRYNDDLNQETLIEVSYEDSFYKPSLMVIDGETNNLVWQGRNLMSQDLYDVTYTYNSSGLRTSKQVNNVLAKYIYEGSKLIGKKVIENNVETTLIYNYDQHNKIMGLSIGNKEYFYIKDILENIIGIIDQEGNVVVYYKYDAYGNLLQEDIRINNLASRHNDILYKGYVYDRESYLYYLKSRYYNPRLGRFISMDEVSYVNPKDINGLNLYAYCNNNPIMYYDPSGRFRTISLITALAGIVLIAAALFDAKKSKKKYEKNTISHGITSADDITINDGIIYYGNDKNNKIGEYDSTKNMYTIYDSYNYTSDEMRIICDKIAREYTKEDEIKKESDKLYDEWVSHNYAYYFFLCTVDGIRLNQGYKFIYGESLAEKSKTVDFGKEKETRGRKLFLDLIRILADI